MKQRAWIARQKDLRIRLLISRVKTSVSLVLHTLVSEVKLTEMIKTVVIFEIENQIQLLVLIQNLTHLSSKGHSVFEARRLPHSVLSETLSVSRQFLFKMYSHVLLPRVGRV